MPKKDKMSFKESIMDAVSAGAGSVARGAFGVSMYCADDYRAAKELGRMYKTCNEAADKRRKNLKDCNVDEFNAEMDACRDIWK